MSEEIITKLSSNLAELIEADYILVGLLESTTKVTTEVVIHQGELLNNISYSLKGTPCEVVLNTGCCIYTDHVIEKFPEDQLLVDMEIKAYIGVVIYSSDKQVIGILVALYNKPIIDTASLKCLMESFSLSMSAEYSRRHHISQVEDIKKDLREQVSRLEKQQEVLKQAQRIAKFASYEIDVIKGKINWSAGIDKILFIDVNHEKYTNWSGVSVDEPWMEYIVLKDRKKISDTLKNTIKNSESYRIQYTACLPDGRLKTMLTEGIPINDENGVVIAIRGFLQDITESNATQTALINREKRLKSLFDNSPLAIIDWGLDFTIKGWNHSAERIFGWRKDEVINKVGDFILPEDIKVDVSKIWQGLVSGQGGEYSINKNKTKNRGDIVCEWRNATVYGANDEILSVVSYIEDITKKFHEEELAKQFEEKFLAIFNASPDAITVTRKNSGEFVDVNKGFEQITGFSRDEAIGQTSLSLNLIEQEDREEYINHVFNKGTVSDVEINFHNREGEDLFALYSANVVTINDEELIIAYCHDITERKKSAQQLVLHRDNLQYLIEVQTKDLVGAKNEAVQANRYKSEFLANMSHEIRTPMNAITGLTYLALQTKLDERQRDYLVKIDTSAKNLLLLINDILDFSKVESGHLNIEPEPFRIDELLENITDLIRNKSNEKGLELIIQYPGNIPLMLVGDALRLSQVLTNLASNAVKFTETGFVKIEISLKYAADEQVELLFTVMDTGIGMSPAAVKNLFKPFEQADGSITRKFGGTGLGLSISQKLVCLMGGEIKARSILHQGTEFYFNLKFDISDSQQTFRDECVELAGKKILIVEDDQSTQGILTEILNTLGMSVNVVDTAEDALTLMAENNNYDLVLLDWKLPGMDGLACAKKIHETFNLNVPALIMVTGYSKDHVGNETDFECLDYFLLKPVTPLLLIKTIKRALGVETNETQALDSSMVDITSVAGARVLLVEDNPINQQVASELLRMRSINTTIANNGAQALDKIKDDEFDLIFMDLQMPVMDGYSAAEKIINDDRYRHIPIIAMTAHAMPSDQKRCMELGMKGHILKPIVIDDIDRALVKWIAPRDGIGSAYIKNTEQQTSSSEYNGFPEAIVGLDLKLGLSLVAGNKDVYLNLLADFSRRYKHVIEQLRVDIEMSNRDYIHDIAHTLTSAAGNLGATDLSKVAATLDLQLQEGTLDPLICNALCQRLAVLIESIDNWQAKYRISMPKENEHISSPSFITLLNNEEKNMLSSYLADDNTAAVELIQKIKQRLQGRASKDLVYFINLIENYEFSDALDQFKFLSQQYKI